MRLGTADQIEEGVVHEPEIPQVGGCEAVMTERNT
jgi:hypothetical protein